MGNPTKKIKIFELRKGDTVLVDGEMQTVASHHLKNDPFFGPLFKGDSHRLTGGEIEIVLFPKWLQGELIGYYSQI
jgi:hypothetical protein